MRGSSGTSGTSGASRMHDDADVIDQPRDLTMSARTTFELERMRLAGPCRLVARSVAPVGGRPWGAPAVSAALFGRYDARRHDDAIRPRQTHDTYDTHDTHGTAQLNDRTTSAGRSAGGSTR